MMMMVVSEKAHYGGFKAALNPSSTHELQHATNIVLQDSTRIYKRIAARIPMSSIYPKGVPRCDKMLKDTCSHEHRYPPRFAL